MQRFLFEIYFLNGQLQQQSELEELLVDIGKMPKYQETTTNNNKTKTKHNTTIQRNNTIVKTKQKPTNNTKSKLKPIEMNKLTKYYSYITKDKQNQHDKPPNNTVKNENDKTTQQSNNTNNTKHQTIVGKTKQNKHNNTNFNSNLTITKHKQSNNNQPKLSQFNFHLLSSNPPGITMKRDMYSRASQEIVMPNNTVNSTKFANNTMTTVVNNEVQGGAEEVSKDVGKERKDVSGTEEDLVDRN